MTSVTDRLFVCPLSDTVAPITGSPFWSVTLPFPVAYAISVEAVPISTIADKIFFLQIIIFIC